MNTTEKALFAAVVRSPDDDAPRLVYADWLIEQGGTAALRGELIQVQCELAGMPDRNKRSPRADRLWERSRDLVTALKTELERSLKGIEASLIDLDYVRGMVQRCGLPLYHLDLGDELVRRFPLIDEMVLGAHLTGVEVEPLLKLRSLSKLRVLSVQGSSQRSGRLGSEGIAALLASSHWPEGLRELNFFLVALGPEGAAALAGHSSLSQLRDLRLENCDLGPKGTSAIARSPHFGQLQTLHLGGNKLGATGGKALAESSLPALKRVTVSDYCVDKKSIGLLKKRFGEGLRIDTRRY